MRIVRIAALTLAVTAVMTAQTTAHAAGSVPRSALPGAKSIDTVQRMVMPEVDVAELLAEDAAKENSGAAAPTRFAVGLAVSFTPDNSGTWETLDDGSRLWRLRMSSPGAQTVSLGLQTFDLPPNARFWVHDRNGAWVQGPYTANDRNSNGGLWTAVVVGEEVVAELHLPNSNAEPNIEISSINHGYRGFEQFTTEESLKRGSCNVNVVCPEGHRFGDQIRAVARIAVSGGGDSYLCTAQLMNNTAEDETPYLLTAGHCMNDESGQDLDPSTLVAYWNYQTATCDQFFGGSLSQNQSGATLIAESFGSDFRLSLRFFSPETRRNA